MPTNSSDASAPRYPQRLRARASLRFLGQPIQKPSVKVPSTPRPRSYCAQACPKIRSHDDTPTYRHRYLSMPSMPNGISGLCCRPAHRRLEFFVMIDQRTKDRAAAPLGARADASVRPISSLHVLLTDSLLSFAIRSQPIVASTTARYAYDRTCRYVCLAQVPPYNPHRQSSLLHPTL